jgi:hypothetical protein
MCPKSGDQVTGNSSGMQAVTALSPKGEGGAQRRVRAARSTILQVDGVLGRATLIRRFRATFLRWEKDPPSFFELLRTLIDGPYSWPKKCLVSF